MTREELFLAIGAVEESRLLRSEWNVSAVEEKQEDKNMKPTRIIRNLLIAAVLVSMMAVSAYAVGSYLIYDTPEEMIAAVFGDRTGHDHGDYTEVTDPERPGSLMAVQPEFDRVEADPTVVAEDVAPYVSPVGQSIQWHGMTLAVDAFVYDSATRCGVITYTLENGPEYYLQYDGQVSYMGRPAPVECSAYGYSHIIQEKTTEEKLAAAFYFHVDDHRNGDGFSFAIRDGMTVEEHQKQREDAMQAVREKYTPEEVIAWAREYLGEEAFQTAVEANEQTEEAFALDMARDNQILEWMEGYEDTSADKIYFNCTQSREMKHRTLENGGITVSPISIFLDIGKLDFLTKDAKWINSDLVNSIGIRFADGTMYQVMDENVSNVIFGLNSTADGASTSDYTEFVLMFNRVIDLDAVSAVVINGREFAIQ